MTLTKSRIKLIARINSTHLTSFTHCGTNSTELHVSFAVLFIAAKHWWAELM